MAPQQFYRQRVVAEPMQYEKVLPLMPTCDHVVRSVLPDLLSVPLYPPFVIGRVTRVGVFVKSDFSLEPFKP
jgi:hypothetical protein